MLKTTIYSTKNNHEISKKRQINHEININTKCVKILAAIKVNIKFQKKDP